MVLPPEVSAKLGWGLLAGGSWFSRRPTRWLKASLTVGISAARYGSQPQLDLQTIGIHMLTAALTFQLSQQQGSCPVHDGDC